MEHARKLILVPADTEEKAQQDAPIPTVSQVGGSDETLGESMDTATTATKATNTEKRPKATPKSRLVAKILLKLARYGAYNDEGQLKDEAGEFVEGSDVLSQIRIALRVQKPKTSSDLFIKLLKESGVTTDMLLNPTVREQLEEYTGNSPTENSTHVSAFSTNTSEEPIIADIPHETRRSRGTKRSLSSPAGGTSKRAAVDPNVLREFGWRTIADHGTRSRKRVLRSKSSSGLRKRRKVV